MDKTHDIKHICGIFFYEYGLQINVHLDEKKIIHYKRIYIYIFPQQVFFNFADKIK